MDKFGKTPDIFSEKFNKAYASFKQALDYYLETTTFGALSIFVHTTYHGSLGKQRAEQFLENLTKVLTLEKLYKLIFKSLEYKGLLSSIVEKYLAYSGIFGPDKVIRKLDQYKQYVDVVAFNKTITDLLLEEAASLKIKL